MRAPRPRCSCRRSELIARPRPSAPTTRRTFFPNGGFEAWDTYLVPYFGEHDLPDFWYGLDIPGSSEIDPAQVRQTTTHVHSGLSAVQLEEIGVAERFTSEAFDLPAGRLTCSYRVRGHLRHRSYSTGGWSTLTDTLAVDSDAWIPVVFQANGNVRDFRLILYPSDTMADRDHLQVDDVVCTRDFRLILYPSDTMADRDHLQVDDVVCTRDP